MLFYERIDIGKGIDLAKSNRSEECMIYHYWFFYHRFKFQDSVCNECHDLTILSVNINDITIITDKNVDYRCIIHKISKSETINLLKNSVLENRGYILKNIVLNFSLVKTVFLLLFLFSIYKMVDSMCIHKPININSGTIMKNSEMPKFVPDNFKTRQICNYTVKKPPCVIRYVQHKT